MNRKKEDLYFSISKFYKKTFGKKVYKIPVTIADTCPNREGLKGMETCIFCDDWGSAAYADSQQDDLLDQVKKHRLIIQERYKAEGFLIYFQSYTNTFLKLSRLKQVFEKALELDDVLGIVVGTRPDCISQGVLNLWEKIHSESFVSVELGVQSFFDDDLEFIKRGHTAQCSLDAIKKINNETGVDLGIHLIFGMPGETDERIIETAQLVSALPINHVKLHNLHVLRGTELERLYNKREFQPIDLHTYARRVELFLSYLSPHIAVHRLTAVASRWDELVAPDWTRYKFKNTEFILNKMLDNGTHQGLHYN